MEKILYTRCSPWIDLLNQGKIVRQEGFGVASVSSNLFSSNINFRLLKRLMEDRKGDMNQFDKIFEYVEVGENTYAFICSGELPLCKETRKNGAGHRPIFMSEAIIGKFPVNAANFMNEENFPGDQRSQNDYYRLDLGQDTQPLPLESVDVNALKPSEIIFSMNPLRQKIVSSIAAYLIDELAKPEAKRTVLFIKADNNEMIGFVDAAIKCLPSSLANKVTFLTHTSSFKSNPERYAYYTLTQTGEVVEYNSFAEEAMKANRKLKYMLVGYTVGTCSRTPRSEFHHIDAKTGQMSFEVEPGAFLSALASFDPAAKKCLAYINEHLGGVFPKDRDAFYNFFKSALLGKAEISKAELEGAIHYFLASPLSSNKDINEALSNYAINIYPSILEEDLHNSLSFIGLASKLDPSISTKLFPSIKDRFLSLLDDYVAHPEVLDIYATLQNVNWLSHVEMEMLGHIHAATLISLVKANAGDSILLFYFNRYLEKVAKGLEKPLLANEELSLLYAYSAMLLRYSKNAAVLGQIDNELRRFGAKREQTYLTTIQAAYKAGRMDDVEYFLNLYRPGLDFKASQLELARVIKELNFGQFEQKFVKAYASNKKDGKLYEETLFALFDVYPEAKKKEFTGGLVYGKMLLEELGDKIEQEQLKHVLEYLLKLKAIRGELPEEFIKGLEEKLMRFVLQGGSLSFANASLEELAIKAPAKLSALKEAITKAMKASDQQKALEEFAHEGGYPIKASDLRLPYFSAILKSLHYEKNYLHVAFLLAFAGNEPKDLVPSYLSLLKEGRETDGMVFYHSLCMVVTLESDSPRIKKIKDAVEALIKPKDNPILESCFEKKYEKRLDEFKEDTPALKKAKERLIADFKEYGDAHKGFFSKLFGRK